MSQQQSVAASGASFSVAAAAVARLPSRPQLLPKAPGTSRTIVETALCPPELKRGDKPWSIQDLKVMRVLGEGALSTVVQCTCCLSGLPIALKMYHRDKLNTLNVKQIGREIDIHASLSHLNVIKLYAAFEDTDGIYLVQEFATGGDLYAELSRHGGYMIEAHVTKHVMAPFLTAISHLHQRSILHRDIKPENILLMANGEIKLADFGLAIDTYREKPISRVGTLDYMPPEIAILPRSGAPIPPPQSIPGSPSYAAASSSAHNTPKVNSPLGVPNSPAGTAPRSPFSPMSCSLIGKNNGGNYGLPVDVWCAGILAYELLVGGPPFEADTKDATYTRILKTEAVIPAHISKPAQDFIRSALQKDPTLRPTIDQLAAHPWLRSVQRAKSLTGSPIVAGYIDGLGEDNNGEDVVISMATPIQKQQRQQQQHQGLSDAHFHHPSSVFMAYSAKEDCVEGKNNVDQTRVGAAVPAVLKNKDSMASAAAFATTAPPTSITKQRVSVTQGLMNPQFKPRQSMQAQAQVQALLSPTMPQKTAAAVTEKVAAPQVKVKTATAAASARTSGTREKYDNVDLIAASYGNNINSAPHALMPSQPVAAVQILARPPPPTSGSTKLKRPRILSAYLKKLNISAFMGIGSSREENNVEGSGEPAVRLSRLGAGPAVL
ncbi:putative Aurora kinase C [Nannochloris sp. 'desiccata']|nr:putative Aurora kinase C [Chlorella desiccata (nom. nud.)]